MLIKKYVGHDVRKTLFGGLRTTKAQTSLRFRSDLKITQLHQTRPSAAERPRHFLGQKGFSRTTFGGLDICLFGLVFFSVSSRLFNAMI